MADRIITGAVERERVARDWPSITAELEAGGHPFGTLLTYLPERFDPARQYWIIRPSDAATLEALMDGLYRLAQDAYQVRDLARELTYRPGGDWLAGQVQAVALAIAGLSETVSPLNLAARMAEQAETEHLIEE